MNLSATTELTKVPLCVDLDGTVLRTDLTWETLLRLLRRNPFYLFIVPFWLLRGRAVLKDHIAVRTDIDPASLPYCTEFLDFLRQQKQAGRAIYLVTASDRRPAKAVATHVGLFKDVLASDGHTNLRGRDKAAMLTDRFSEAGFDYAGNSSVDYPVWEKAREALIVNARKTVAAHAQRRAKVSRVFEPASNIAREIFRTLRPHQWIKNLILFVPLLTAHRLGELELLGKALLAFVAFSLCASAVYLLNDLVDLESDRHHAVKRTRPFASGSLPIAAGFAVFPVLLAVSFGLAFWIAAGFGATLGGYLVLTTAYSLWLKQAALLDVFCLAALYTIRLISGHEATGVKYSFWLLVFSMFIFLSLALVKRFVEVAAARQRNGSEIKGRGYGSGDLELITTLGTSSGYLATLVLALYVNSEEVRRLYDRPFILLLICPLLLYWISRVWLLAHRGQMHDDPVVFALKDKTSYLVGALTLLVLWLATGS